MPRYHNEATKLLQWLEMQSINVRTVLLLLLQLLFVAVPAVRFSSTETVLLCL